MSTQEQYIDIPLGQLHDSPTQPRLVYDDAYLAELGADLKSHGRNLSPLLVRPRVPELFRGTDDPNAIVGYEIVFGHCRKRGLEIAGIPVARCEVRSMTDQEVERAQISENLQRKNVHPFEEAAGFQALIDRHGDTADAIAERTGKSRSYVYGRLKLLQACAEVRKSCLAGEIGAEVALLIARLRSDKLQGKALARIKAKYWDLKDGGQKSFRNIRELLNEEFTLDLKAAPFPIDATNLAGAGACPTCPKRSANAPEYQDVAEDKKTHQWSRQNLGPNVCTDPECFAAKKAAHFKNQAEDLRKKGRAVIDGNKARALVGADGTVKGGYLPIAQVKDELKRATAKLGGVFAPTQVLIQCPRTGKTFEAVKESELVAAGTRNAPTTGNAKAAPSDSAARLAKEKADEAMADKLTAENKALLARVRAAARVAERSLFDLRLIATRTFAEDGGDFSYSDDADVLKEIYGAKSWSELEAQVAGMGPDDISLFMLDWALVINVSVGSWDLDIKPTALLAAAEHYGVDLADDAASTPSTAARAQEDGEAGADEATETPSPSPAAQAPATAAATLTPVQAWPFPDPDRLRAKYVKSQAGSAGKKAKGAGSAGDASSTTPADAGEGVPA